MSAPAEKFTQDGARWRPADDYRGSKAIQCSRGTWTAAKDKEPGQ